MINLFTCLVHESPDVIWDTVRNLRHLDPTSHILLYNNSGDAELLTAPRFSSDPYVNIYPTPEIHPYGILHGYMLDCMRWACQNLKFDTITNVDSDQLLLQPSFTLRLAEVLQAHPNLGLLHSNAHNPGLSARWTAYRYHSPIWTARREMVAWLPFLNKYGSDKAHFPRWAFWPSSVFSRRAAEALLDLIDTSEHLRFLMRRTRIFATEEVILPTLISLLGFDLVPTPFDDTCLRWRAQHSLSLVEESLTVSERLWIHPVPRLWNNPIRSCIRQQYNNYASA